MRLEHDELQDFQPGDAPSSLPKYFYQSGEVGVLGGDHAVLEHHLAAHLHSKTTCSPFKPHALSNGETKSHVCVLKQWCRPMRLVNPALTTALHVDGLGVRVL